MAGEHGGVPLVFTPTYGPELDWEPSLGARLGVLNAGIATAYASVDGRLGALTQRVVGSEAAHSSLQADARAVLEGIVGQARQEFARQG